MEDLLANQIQQLKQINYNLSEQLDLIEKEVKEKTDSKVEREKLMSQASYPIIKMMDNNRLEIIRLSTALTNLIHNN